MRCSRDWTSKGTGLASERYVEIVDLAPGRSAWLPDSVGALLRLIREAPQPFSVVTLDAQRCPDPKDQPQSYREWLHGVDALVECAASALHRDGTTFMEIEPTSLSVYLETLDRHGLRVVEAIVWQKKYAGQNSRRDLENLHDYILVAKHHASASPVPTTFLPYKVAGKSEDAAKEFNELAQQALGEGAPRAPEPLKPAALFKWLTLNRVGSVDSLLDLTSCAGSWTSQVVERCPTTVDVVWPDEPWFEASSWFLKQRIGGPQLKRSTTESVPDWQSSPCECELVSRAAASAHRLHVRLDFEDGIGATSAVEAVTGEVNDLIDSLSPFLRGRVLDSFGTLSLLAKCGEELSGLLTADGVAALLLEGPWPADLLDLTRAVGHARIVGTLALHAADDVVGDAQILVLVSARARRYKAHPLWRARQRVYANPDSDPRGTWRDKKHKGSRSGGPGTSFRLFRPPYTWTIASGQLPPGLWRLNPVSGVIWGKPDALGSWTVQVQATDSSGQSATASVSFDVVPQSEADAQQADASDCQWLFEPLLSGGRLRVKRRRIQLPVGLEASIVMEASGGSPYIVEVPPPGRSLASGKRTRYWEFNKDTLLEAVLNDSLIFTRKLDGKPSEREHEPPNSARHAAMPSVMSSDGLSAREFFWARIARSSEGDIALDWSGAPDDAEVCFAREGSAGGRWASASACEPCLEAVEWGEGCCKEHAVQPAGLLLRPGASTDPQELVDLCGRVAGVLFSEVPVSAESLQLLALNDSPGKVLIVNGTSRTDTELTVEKVAWRS